MDGHDGSRVRIWTGVVAAAAAAFVWAGAVAPAWPAARGLSAGGRPAGSWSRAIDVPGLAALNKGEAHFASVSCGAAGSCAVGGDYRDRHGHRRGFVADERNGRWGTAIDVPGLAALSRGRDAEVFSVSCGAAGSCAAGGDYAGRHARRQGFVADERNGRWGKAIEIPGLGTLNKGKVDLFSVSCGSAGNCAAGGQYEDGHGAVQGFVAVERNGSWGRAIEVPGLGALNKDGEAQVFSVSCAPAGGCAAGGGYAGRNADVQGFVTVERNGRWGTAIEVPGLAALNKFGEADVESVSCASAAYCVAGGNYRVHDSVQVFVAADRNGVWGRAVEVPGLAALNVGHDNIADALIGSVSCASAGNCATGGSYTDRQSNSQGFVAVERNGRWRKAVEVPGLAALNKGGDADVSSVSCASAGTCAAVGHYFDHGYQRFVVDEKNGRWGQAIEIPGLAALNKGGDADVGSVSCAPAGSCAAGGSYTDGHDHYQVFVVSQTG